MPTRTAPAPGKAPLPARNAAALLRRNGTDAAVSVRPAIRAGDDVFTHSDLLDAGRRRAGLFRKRLRPDAPPHVGVLLDNIPEYLFTFAGAALAGAAVVGLNHTRRGEHLLRDVSHTDCQLLITEPRHRSLLEPIADRLPPVLVVGSSLGAALAETTPLPTDAPEPDVSTTWALIFTSGTSTAPKAVICSHRRLLVTGARMQVHLGIGPEDVGYICMPLFHSNALMVVWMPSLVAGASVALAPRFSTSAWLGDVRRYGATWFGYTGKPLSFLMATPERPDDADNPLRIAFGNEGSPQVVSGFARRFGLDVVEAFGATEGAVGVAREPDMPVGSVGRVTPNVKVVDDAGVERERARFDATGALTNAADCVGEIVNTDGSGPFEGYYGNDEANERALRFGWYWSGDLGYVTGEGWLFFAGRTGDWIRVDGENFPAGPIADALARHADVVVAAAYGVPDADAGDQVMAALQWRPGADPFDGAAFAAWLDSQPDVGPKWRPRYLRLAGELPTTGTNKVVVRDLMRQKWRRDLVGGDEVWLRDRGDAVYRPFAAADEKALRRAMEAAGRARFWEL
ncbi:MAG: AMP-binding protein [Acidimicrobiales bacterium]